MTRITAFAIYVRNFRKIDVVVAEKNVAYGFAFRVNTNEATPNSPIDVIACLPNIIIYVPRSL